jgi:YidC/Oxa1 family membrane protein insertase
MEKRVYLAIVLCFVALAVYQVAFPPPPPPLEPSTSTTTSIQAPAVSASDDGGATPANDTVPTPASTAPPVVSGGSARDITVDTKHVRAVFSTAGGILKSWRLKGYLDDGQPLELVPQDVPDSFPQPFTLTTADSTVSATLAKAIFKPSTEALDLGTTPGQMTFEYQDQSGLRATKTFYFQPEGRAFVLKVDAAIDLGGSSRPVTMQVGPWLGRGYQPDGSQYVEPRAIFHLAGDVTRHGSGDLSEQHQFQGEFRFAGVEDQYFLSAALPGTEPVTVDFSPRTVPVHGASKPTNRTFIAYSLAVPGSLSTSFFIGPKDFDVLKAVDPRRELVRAIDFGITAPIVVPLLTALKWVNGLVHNYGWAIVLLTVIINVLLFPLRHTSMVSMRKMQALQPEVKAIQERYAKYKVTDPERQKMNQEMLSLYKQKGVNPASGCVPMLLTLPILFAFYALLSAAIELRGAPFFGWITDLSRHDPLYITPVLMGGTMFWQQKMMPTTADPIQQRIFLLMPIIFTVSFLWMPAGLVVYWLVSNLLAIGQQYLTNRMIGVPAPARAVAAPRK